MMKYVITCLSLLLVCCTAKPTKKSPPNIVMILADDLGYDDLSHRGSDEIPTPNIDAIGYYGKIMKNLYTAPVCTPTRSSLLTGKYPIKTGINYEALRNTDSRSPLANLTTFSEVLRKSGYSTNLVGKWHMGIANGNYTPCNNGFDSHFGYLGAYIDYYTRACLMDGDPDTAYGYDFRRNLNVSYEHPNKYVTDLLTDEAERIILNNKGEKPLFMLVAQLAPHAGNKNARLQAPLKDIARFNYIKDENRRTYAAMVHKLDQSVGRIVKALDKGGLLDNTIIVFSSDNGAPIGPTPNAGSNWPLRGQKNSTWEGGVHVGGVIWSPLLNGRGSIFEQPMHYVDWFPTLTSAAGIKLGNNLDLDGIDFWDQLTAKKSKTVDRDIVNYYTDAPEVISFTHGSWKYIKGTTLNGTYDKVLSQRELVNVSPKNYPQAVLNSDAAQSLQKFDKKKLTESRIKKLRKNAGVKCDSKLNNPCNALGGECLFNIAEDPCESNNLSQSSKHQQILKDLKTRFDKHKKGMVKQVRKPNTVFDQVTYHNCIWTFFEQDPPTKTERVCNAPTIKCAAE